MLATIFLTLLIGPFLVGRVSESLIVVGFAAGMVLVGIAVLTQGLKVTPAGVEVGIVLGMAAVFLFLAVRLSIPERSHLLEFGVLAILVYEALLARSALRKIPGTAFWTFLVCTGIGVLDESLQLLIPDRVFDWEDILFNTLAVLTAVAGMWLLRYVRGR